jgi:hypothetical protein
LLKDGREELGRGVSVGEPAVESSALVGVVWRSIASRMNSRETILGTTSSFSKVNLDGFCEGCVDACRNGDAFALI